MNCKGPLIHGCFSIYSQPSVSLSFASVYSPNYRQKTVFFIHSWECMDMEGQLYASLYAILYEGLEHPWILLSIENPRTNALCIPRDNCKVLGESEVIHGFSTSWEGRCSLTPALLNGQLYIHMSESPNYVD